MADGTAASTVVVEDKSPQRMSSTESNFRELDDAYLQTQARIWLGEVLQIRFDEEIDISDLLADGELLFEVSEVISKRIPLLHVDDTQNKVYEWKTLASNKSTRRYMPYYNVDSFLRMCKNLGIDGIDLFAPSDVVERRNTRKVCMCLRSLSKKSRLRDLNVPDFDSVTCTLAMPTDMVEGIRKSLEMSQSTSSLSAEQEVEKVSRVRVWQRMSNSTSAVSNGYSDNCDEAESRFVVAESSGSSDYAYDAESPIISGSPQEVGEYSSELQLSMGADFKNEDDDQCEYLSPSNAESVGSPCSHYYSDGELSVPSSNDLGSHISSKVPKLNSETNHGYQFGDVRHVPINWEDSHLNLGNVKDANDDEVDCVSHDNIDVDTTSSHDIYLIGDDICNKNLGTSNNLSIVDCDKSSELGEPPECAVTGGFHVVEAPYLSDTDVPSENNSAKHEPFVRDIVLDVGEPCFHGKTDDKVLSSELLIQGPFVSKPSEYPDFLYDSENQASNTCTEVLNVGENSCYDRLINGNATSEDVAGQLRCHEEKSPCSVDCDGHSCNCSSLLSVKSNANDDQLIPARFVSPSSTSPSLLERYTISYTELHCSPIQNDRMSFDDKKITPDFKDVNESNLSGMPHMNLNSVPYVVVAENGTKFLNDCHDAMKGSKSHNALVESVDDKLINTDNANLVNSFASALCDPQSGESPKIVEDTNHKHLCRVKDAEKGESDFAKQEDTEKDVPVHKPQRKLLKSVVKGTALVGIAVFLLHLRKNRRENLSEAKKRPIHFVIQGTPKPLQKGNKGGSTSSVYPAEKLKLGI
ncbi:uncharacterized protein LOC110686393 [Chenopodium quinoa]|uniref:Calponin-homology (CH) domain-containing protein n=1 Tax=Chenopodium quinoa TaxID=63459 RepID=A0A803N1V2_CHEQI|nr:uncharacterized protein LOC110686393 [Chenopodium quinoa]